MNSPRQPSPWWTPDRHADRRIFLQKRASIAQALRDWFRDRAFAEVETSVLQVSPGNETHLHAPQAATTGPDGARQRRYLRTSPEFACKKLLAAGEDRIVEFARVFRDRERGALHLPEFTMLEWYRANEPYEAIITDTLSVIAEAAHTAGSRTFAYRGRTADPFAPAERITVAEAFKRHAHIDLRGTYDKSGTNRDALAAAAAGQGIRVTADDTWSDIFSKILVEKVEPQLGQGRLTVLDAYPLPEAALARPNASDPLVAERFEVYACGVELANGFGELTDAVEQRRRFTAAMDEKEKRYGERYPLDEDFLAALGQMPPASGVALGFDRLVMLSVGAVRVDQVVWTPQNDT
jgi:lysyl-tRNA synthetase class 2